MKLSRYRNWFITLFLLWLAFGYWNTPIYNGRPVIIGIDQRLQEDYLKKSDSILEAVQVLDVEEKSIPSNPSKLVSIAQDHQAKVSQLLAAVDELNPPKSMTSIHTQLKDLLKTRVEYSQTMVEAYSENNFEKIKQKDRLKLSYLRKTDAYIESIRVMRNR